LLINILLTIWMYVPVYAYLHACLLVVVAEEAEEEEGAR
jgi:hypothetical protein